MTEKRFTYGLRKGTTQYEIKDNLHEYPIVEPFYYKSYAKKVCNFLNELNDENERLKQQLRIFSDGLKAEIRETKEVFEDYSECLDEKLELKRENEQLRKDQQRLYNDNIRVKQLITEAHSNERTAIGRSVLLQIIEQI